MDENRFFTSNFIRWNALEKTEEEIESFCHFQKIRHQVAKGYFDGKTIFNFDSVDFYSLKADCKAKSKLNLYFLQKLRDCEKCTENGFFTYEQVIHEKRTNNESKKLIEIKDQEIKETSCEICNQPEIVSFNKKKIDDRQNQILLLHQLQDNIPLFLKEVCFRFNFNLSDKKLSINPLLSYLLILDLHKDKRLLIAKATVKEEEKKRESSPVFYKSKIETTILTNKKEDFKLYLTIENDPNYVTLNILKRISIRNKKQLYVLSVTEIEPDHRRYYNVKRRKERKIIDKNFLLREPEEKIIENVTYPDWIFNQDISLRHLIFNHFFTDFEILQSKFYFYYYYPESYYFPDPTTGITKLDYLKYLKEEKEKLQFETLTLQCLNKIYLSFLNGYHFVQLLRHYMKYSQTFNFSKRKHWILTDRKVVGFACDCFKIFFSKIDETVFLPFMILNEIKDKLLKKLFSSIKKQLLVHYQVKQLSTIDKFLFEQSQGQFNIFFTDHNKFCLSSSKKTFENVFNKKTTFEKKEIFQSILSQLNQEKKEKQQKLTI